MHLRVLGCHGGESPTHRTTSFLIDGKLLLDAGAATRSLALAEQAQIEAAVISHSHLDHIRDLALLADNVIGVRTSPLIVYCTEPTANTLEKHFFNDLVWTDFTKIPNPSDKKGSTVVVIERIKSGETFKVCGYRLHTVAVNHPVDCQAMIISGPSGTLAYSGDTGPTEALWDAVNNVPDLRAFIYEVSFPNAMKQLAQVSGHLTPAMMAAELKKFRPKSSTPILLYHLKPGFFELLKTQIAELGDSRLTILKPLDEFEL